MSHLFSSPPPIPQIKQSWPATLSYSSLFSARILADSHLSKSSKDPSLGGIGFHRPSKWVSGLPFFSVNRGRLIQVCCQGRDDGFYMRMCVELARRAVGCTSPNPMVGCVIVKGGEIVGQGFHPKAGQPHAEVFALKDAGVLSEDATAYVSLEPCNHYGRTPPCTEALIRAKVKRVVVGMVDPNPIVASKGVVRLRESGIEVVVGVEEMLCRKLNEAYIHRMVTGKPFVALRYTLSFNGRVLDNLGKGAEESGGYYSQLLQEYDGVVISSDSLKGASALPRSHETGANQPLQIIIASDASYLPPLPGLTGGSSAKVVVLAEAEDDGTVEPEIEGVETAVLAQLNLSSILDYCASRGLCNVLLDLRGDSGGLGELVEDGLEEQLVQKVVMEVCPVWDTSDETFDLAFGRRSFRLKDVQSRILDESVVLEGCISYF